MNDLKYHADSDGLTIALNGQVDSSNAKQLEQSIRSVIDTLTPKRLVLDCTDLTSISSAGLRVILRLKQSIKDTRLINANPMVYDVLQMTGFTEMMDISKAYRIISVDGCEQIGQGANGIVYRIDPDTIVKVYKNPDALPEIHNERELARTAFVMGVPTAISYDVVRIQGGGYGAVYELLNAKSYIKLLIQGEKTLDELVDMSVDLLRIIHSCQVKPDSMPDIRMTALGWVDDVQAFVTPGEYEKLKALFEAIPEDNHMIHGDYHLKNIMLQNGESLLIDMDTLCHGHPIFELAAMFNAYRGFVDPWPQQSEDFLGVPAATAAEIWDKSLRRYLGDADEAKVRAVEQRAALIGHTRLVRRVQRKKLMDTPSGRAIYENSLRQVAELLKVVDHLTVE